MKFKKNIKLFIILLSFFQSNARENVQKIKVEYTTIIYPIESEIEISPDFTITELKEKISQAFGEPYLRIESLGLIYKTGTNEIYLNKNDLNPNLRDSNKLRTVNKNKLGMTLNSINPGDKIELFPNDEFNIYANTLTGDRREIKVRRSDTIRQLKKKIAEAFIAYSIENQRLVFKGKQLNDDQTIKDIAIEPGEVISVIYKKAGKRVDIK